MCGVLFRLLSVIMVFHQASVCAIAQRVFVPEQPGKDVFLTTAGVSQPVTVAKNPPKLAMVVRLPKEAEVPDELRQYLLPEGTFSNRRLLIDGSDREAIWTAITTPEFHAEFERPKVYFADLDVAPANLNARNSHRVPEFEAAFQAIRGAGVRVALFDEGQVRATHKEFQEDGASRVKVVTKKATSLHSTHCAGTIAAKGVKPQAIGMATRARIISYDWGGDLYALGTDSDSFQVSSHSYTPCSGWVPNRPTVGVWNWWGGPDDDEDARYGKYTDECSQLDEVLAKRRNLVTFFASGNDRGRGPQQQPTKHVLAADGSTSSRVRSRVGGESGLDSISGLGIAKNAICIGAINDIPQGDGAHVIEVTGFSGVGPADDGRIKPDLVANGQQLFSTSDADDEAYAELSGTSMATPTAAGIGADLWDLYRETLGRAPYSCEIKAALIHTARDAGVAGPDPQYGWGAIDAYAAGKLIEGSRGEFIGDPVVNTLSTGESKVIPCEPTGDPIRVTIVWTDPMALANQGGIDDSTPALLNDLDLQLIAPGGQLYRPYSLDIANLWDATTSLPKLARTDRPNRVDNVEVVDAPSAVGEWKIEVRGFKVSEGGRQPFAIAVNGLNPK